jgi:hypothetical protein
MTNCREIALSIGLRRYLGYAAAWIVTRATMLLLGYLHPGLLSVSD